MKKSIYFILLVFSLQLSAQTPPVGLDCAGYRSWIKTNFYDGKHIQLGYLKARQKMYAYADNINDTITCVYSGYKKFFKYGTETTAVSPINCEHTVPQSFFSSAEPMLSDINHLYPTYGNWNSERSNNQLKDIEDIFTTKWMRTDQVQGTIPSTLIDDYAESTGFIFEPREVHKGNAARSIFYFFTMYPQLMDKMSSTATLATLYAWHMKDPVDALELRRDSITKVNQGNGNPFVQHPDWVDIAWINGCSFLSNTTEVLSEIKLSPNPVYDFLNIPSTTDTHKVKIYNTLGQLIKEINNQNTIDVSTLSPGSYFVHLLENDVLKVGKFLKE
jgi:Endonuclease I/Secretion system C-terminal sorting domain